METNKMETRDIFPLLMSMSLPMVLSMLVQSLYNIIDSIYVSSYRSVWEKRIRNGQMRLLQWGWHLR